MTNTGIRIIGKDDLDIERIRAETTNLQEEIRRKEDEREKLRAEASKMWTEARWYPVWVGAAIFAAGAAVAKLFLQ